MLAKRFAKNQMDTSIKEIGALCFEPPLHSSPSLFMRGIIVRQSETHYLSVENIKMRSILS